MSGRSALFDRWVSHLIDVTERGFVNDPDDPGLATNWGISLRFALTIGDSDGDGRADLDLDGDGDVDAADIRAMPRAAAVHLYHQHFWTFLHGDELPAPLAFAVGDAGVNQGRGPAVSMLQGVLGVKVDGRLGRLTLAEAAGAVRADGVLRAEVLDHYMAARAQRYVTTANYLKYGKGWFRRLFNVHRLALDELIV